MQGKGEKEKSRGKAGTFHSRSLANHFLTRAIQTRCRMEPRAAEFRSGYLGKRRMHGLRLGRLRHDGHALLDRLASEVLIHRKQGIRFHFPKRSSQFPLNSVQRMEIIASLYIHLPAAQPPVRAQKKMVAEYIVFESGERVAADVGEIADIILVHPDIGPSRMLAPAAHQADLTQEFLFRDARPESRVTGAKAGAEHAATRRGATPATVRYALPIANLTCDFA